jgi:hypothetical protein
MFLTNFRRRTRRTPLAKDIVIFCPGHETVVHAVLSDVSVFKLDESGQKDECCNTVLLIERRMVQLASTLLT